MYIELMKDKSATIAIPMFNLIIKRLELELGEKVILVRSNNGTGEFSTLYRAYLGTI